MNKKQEARTPPSQNSLWHAGFPYPRSWLRSFALALWMAIVVRIAEFWGALFGIALSSIMEHLEPLLWFLGLALLASSLAFSYIHHLLLGKPSGRWPRWLPSPKSLWEGLYAPIVMSMAIIVGIICVMPFHDENYNQTAIETEAKWFGAIWFIATTYLYQVEYLIRRRFASKSKTAPNQPSSNKPVDDTDVELDRLRGRMGLTQMKKRKSNPPT